MPSVGKFMTFGRISLMLPIGLAFAITLFFSVSCKKEAGFNQNTKLEFSTDTLIFDTVFTTVGSVTKNFKIYNPAQLRTKIDQIYLAGGSASPFRINVDGIAGAMHSDIEIAGKDSLYIFVEVTLSVNGTNHPMVIEDSVVFVSGNRTQSVKLVVWGQDAYFHANELVSGLWPNDKPHVVYGVVAVGYPGLDSNQTLTIPAGTNVHFHNKSSMIVYKSTLQVQGGEGSEVVFTGDRLDPYYRDLPGQWSGIYMLMSNNSVIEHAIIKHATTAIRCDTVFTQGTPALTIRNTEVFNNTFAGIIGLGSHIISENCLIADAGFYCVYLGWGGTYQFNHATVANYYTFGGRNTPSFVINNWYESAVGNIVRDLNNVRVQNSIIFGTLEEEFAVDTLAFGFKDFRLEDVIIKSVKTQITNPVFYQSVWKNDAPGFMATGDKDFTLTTNAFARGKANPATALPFDLNNHARDAQPDLGCYEFH
jgi:hypothetical protein